MVEEKRKLFEFFVDAKEYHTEHESLTGADIKRIANIPETYQLYLEEEGDTPDKAISDSTGENLAHKIKHFFAVPPATFGC
jgi:hypothetical protein